MNESVIAASDAHPGMYWIMCWLHCFLRGSWSIVWRRAWYTAVLSSVWWLWPCAPLRCPTSWLNSCPPSSSSSRTSQQPWPWPRPCWSSCPVSFPAHSHILTNQSRPAHADQSEYSIHSIYRMQNYTCGSCTAQVLMLLSLSLCLSISAAPTSVC